MENRPLVVHVDLIVVVFLPFIVNECLTLARFLQTFFWCIVRFSFPSFPGHGGFQINVEVLIVHGKE